MASALKNLSTYNAQHVPSAKEMKIGIVVADYHTDITYALLEGSITTLEKQGASPDNIEVVHAPGTFELPMAASILLRQSPHLEAVLCIGCVIKGETQHDEYINHAVAGGIMDLSLKTGKPIIFGVLTPNTHQQAKDRSGGKHGNKGVEIAIAAIKMVALNLIPT